MYQNPYYLTYFSPNCNKYFKKLYPFPLYPLAPVFLFLKTENFFPKKIDFQNYCGIFKYNIFKAYVYD